MGIQEPKEWFFVLDALEEEKGIAIILGATDTGKSTLETFVSFPAAGSLASLGFLQIKGELQ